MIFLIREIENVEFRREKVENSFLLLNQILKFWKKERATFLPFLSYLVNMRKSCWIIDRIISQITKSKWWKSESIRTYIIIFLSFISIIKYSNGQVSADNCFKCNFLNLPNYFDQHAAYRYTIFYRFILGITIYKRGTNPRRPIWSA